MMTNIEKQVRICERVRLRSDMVAAAERAASGFAALGVREGDVVALLLRNDFPFPEAMSAAAMVGAYCVPINWHGTPDDVAYVLTDSGAKVLVVHADLLTPLRGVLPAGLAVIVVPTPTDVAKDFDVAPERCEPSPDAVVWERWLEGFARWDRPPRPRRASFIYTSGTTGRPKGVRREPMTPAQVETLGKVFALAYGVRPGIRAYIGGPLYHASPNAFLRHALAQAELLVLSSRFDPERLLADIERHRLTTLVMVPTMFVRLLKLPERVRKGYDVSSLEWVFHTGAPCPPDVKRSMIGWWGPVLHETYGGTETGIVTVCSSHDWLGHPGTVGRPAPGVEIRIVGLNGESMPTGEPGEIFARSHAYADFAYHGQVGQRRAVERDGLITGGDIGYLDADGYLYLCDRARDMIIAGGVNIYPAEIEAALGRMPGIADCAVFGVPHEEWGEAVHAVIQPEPDARLTGDAVIAFAREHLAKFKIPRTVEFMERLPREESGKLLKRKLRDPHWAKAKRAI